MASTLEQDITQPIIDPFGKDVLWAGSHDDEDAFNCDTDRYDRRKIRVSCPHCKRVGSPLCSPKTIQYKSGWRWVGCDHKEPYSSHVTQCRCGGKYRFDVFIGQ